MRNICQVEPYITELHPALLGFAFELVLGDQNWQTTNTFRPSHYPSHFLSTEKAKKSLPPSCMGSIESENLKIIVNMKGFIFLRHHFQST